MEISAKMNKNNCKGQKIYPRIQVELIFGAEKYEYRRRGTQGGKNEETLPGQ
jgi:hypothetical protein